ncbi:MAG: hypothetical protein AAF170_07095 [Bacteroidota bacterium]
MSTAPAERIAPTVRALTGLEVEPLVSSDAVRKVAKAEAERPAATQTPSFSTPLVGRAGEEDKRDIEAIPVFSRRRTVDSERPATAPAPQPSRTDTPDALPPVSTGPLPGPTPPLPHAVTALDEPVGVDGPMPVPEPTAPTTLHQPDTRTALPDEAAPRSAAPVPTRLAVPVWLERLTPSGDRHVQVGLGEDGSVRLQTVRQPDGITVQIQFTDPELQALAGVHADRLRAALETHFAEPVRLSLPDGLATDSGTADSGASDSGFTGSRQHDASPTSESRPSDSESTSPTPTRAPLGRREWVG